MGATKVQKLLKSMAVTSDVAGPEMILPNNSGDHAKSIKRNTPTGDKDLVNKEYVDSLVTAILAILPSIYLTLNASNAPITQLLTLTKGVIINEGGGDNDTRIEGDTDANLLCIDAGNDRVGIGTNSPATKLDVNGTFNASDNATISGSLVMSGGVGHDITIGQDGSENRSNNLILTDGGDKIFWIRNNANTFDIRDVSSGASRMNIASNGDVGIGTTNPTVSLEVAGVDGLVVPVGATGDRVATRGCIRYNTTTSKFEGYDGSGWVDFY